MRISVYDAIRYMLQYNLLISMTVPVQIGFLIGMFQPPKKEHPVTRWFGSAAQAMHCTSFEAKNQPHCKTTYQTNIYQRNSACVSPASYQQNAAIHLLQPFSQCLAAGANQPQGTMFRCWFLNISSKGNMMQHPHSWNI